MFAAPPEIEARVFTRMPDRFRRTGRPSAWGNAMAAGRAVDCFLEGPSFDRDGNLYVVDIPWGRVFRVSTAGDWTLVAEYDGEPNGLKFHTDGSAWIADHARGILRLDAATGAVSPLVERPRHERFKGCNDLFFAADGTLYFTDQGQTGLHDPTGRLYRLSPDQRLDCLLDRVPSPNGLVTNLAENVVYLAVTRANAVWRVPLMSDGRPTKVGTFIQLSGGHAGPDGMALDAAGNLVVCHAGLGCVWLFSPLGEPLLRVRSPAGLMTTNAAYGGAGGRQLFITESDTGSILVADMPEPGRRMFA